MKIISTHTRSTLPELMDDFSLDEKSLLAAFKDINKVNRLLNGNKITRKGVERLIGKEPNGKEVVIIDIGCGDGELLQLLADSAIKHQRKIRLIGIDNNEKIIAHAKNTRSSSIKFMHKDIVTMSASELQADIFVLSLTLHHFKDTEVEPLLHKLSTNAKMGIVINDLHRSWLAYQLFLLFAFFFIQSPVAKKDGATSILRGFKKKELQAFANKIKNTKHHISWKWAFRYQWILQHDSNNN